MSTTSDARVGTTLAGYRIERLLGRGGMSVVYLAEDLRLGRRVALKLIAPELAADERFRERFLRESRIAASLDHSNVIPIYEAGEAEGLLHIAMRYVEGTDLKSVLARSGPLPVAMVLDIVGQTASALDLAHARGLVHRDVKPANILLADEDERGRGLHVYLSDFGLTKQASSESGLTETGQFVGTAEYIAPEQIEHADVGAWSDVYALACVLFECLTGEPPFRRDALMAMLWAHVHDPPPAASERRRGLPSFVDQVIARGMAKEPRDRYPTCGALVTAARGALSLGAARPEKRLERLARKPALVLAALAAVAVAAGLVFVARDDAAAGPTVALDADVLQRIDSATNRLVATVPVDGTVGQLAADREGVWVLNVEGGGFWRVDPGRNAVTATGLVAGEPASIVSGLGSVWVANREGAIATSATVTEIDPDVSRPRRAIPIPVSQVVPNQSMLSGIAVSGPALGLPSIWVGSPFGLAVHRLRPRLGSVVATVQAGLSAPRTLAVGEGAVWVAQAFAVTRIDPGRNAVAETIPLPFSPRDVAAGAGAVWIVNGTGDSIWVVDPETNRVVDRVPVGREPVAVAVGGGAVWVANRGDGTVTRIDPARGRVIATVEVGGQPEDVAVGKGAVWVAVHGAPGGTDGRFTQEEFLATLESVTSRHRELWLDAWQPMRRALNDPSRPWLDHVDPDIAREVARLVDRVDAELRALRPPKRFEADHERLLASMTRYRRFYAEIAEGIAAGYERAILEAVNGLGTEVVALGTDLSAEYKARLISIPIPGEN
jgi:serine/threonine-protein kinase